MSGQKASSQNVTIGEDRRGWKGYFQKLFSNIPDISYGLKIVKIFDIDELRSDPTEKKREDFQ